MTACNPESVQFYQDGAEWLFTTFPDIGGVNLENGDWTECWNDDCVAARADPENDPSFYWDMMASQRDIIEVGLKHNPDAWMTFATYHPVHGKTHQQRPEQRDEEELGPRGGLSAKVPESGRSTLNRPVDGYRHG